ncbi:MAG: LysM peptidoglycan-binding domain-containing protein [Rhizobiaceae bacterium]|nr:LysM peptidoglycan-binding domain-containing protein [Rhizobiaceae bacterium]
MGGMAENPKSATMAPNVVRVLLVAGAGAVVILAGAAAYLSGLLDPWVKASPPVVADQSEPAAANPPGAASPTSAAAPESAESVAAAAAETESLPAFELLRVEPDGSTVIAGRAGAEAQVEVLAGETLIAKAMAGAGGDFAIVLDEPLKPGDYEITLRATDPAGTVSRSEATAIVSVPETPDGQVLALVERPGEASQIMVAPEPGKVAELAVPSETAPGASDPAAALAPADAAATSVDAEVAAVDPSAAAPAAVDALPAVAAPAPGGTAPLVAVEAVEIEGSKVFVAGAADPGHTVRVYANDIHLGDAKSSTQGRFLIEATRNLPVGNYIIRADVLGPSAEVLSRAAVPFEREPGDSIAAVSPGVAAAMAEGEAAVAAARAEATAGAAPKPAAAEPAAAANAEDAVADPEAQVASSDAESGSTVAPAAGADAVSPEIAEESAGAPEPVAPSVDTEVAAAEPQAGEPAASEPASDRFAPAIETPPAASDVQPAAEAVAGAAPPARTATTAAAEPAMPNDVRAAEAVEPAAPAATSTEVAAADPAVTQPKLQTVTRSVIIRKGDSLWKISRRAYGQGMRYSTLYLANRDQIQDPSKIWIGQVFTVPDLTE